MSSIVTRGVAIFCVISFTFSWPMFFVVDAWLIPQLTAAGDAQQARVVAMAGHMFAMMGPALAAWITFRMVHKSPLPALRMGRPLYYLWAALAMFLVFGLPSALGLGVGKSLSLTGGVGQTELLVLLATLTIGWVAAMGEEAGWCMYLLTALRDEWGKTRAILFSGIVRGLWHWPVLVGAFLYQAFQGDMALGELALRSLGIAVQLMISNIFFGALFGWLWYKTESLPLVGWMHICYDFARDASFIFVIGFQASGFYPLWAVPFNLVAVILLIALAKSEGITPKTLFKRPAPPAKS